MATAISHEINQPLIAIQNYAQAARRRCREQGADVPVIVITGHGDVPMAVQAMKAGAVEFLQKPYRDQALLYSINAALSVDAARRRSLLAAGDFEKRRATLTEREREVFDHLLAGRPSKEIARALAISPRTAEAHRRNLLQKDAIHLPMPTGN